MNEQKKWMIVVISFIADEIKKQKECLDSGEFDYYKDFLTNGNESDCSVSELVMSADIEGDEFNIGFEQGFIRGMEVILSDLQEDLKNF